MSPELLLALCAPLLVFLFFLRKWGWRSLVFWHRAPVGSMLARELLPGAGAEAARPAPAPARAVPGCELPPGLLGTRIRRQGTTRPAGQTHAKVWRLLASHPGSSVGGLARLLGKTERYTAQLVLELVDVGWLDRQDRELFARIQKETRSLDHRPITVISGDHRFDHRDRPAINGDPSVIDHRSCSPLPTPEPDLMDRVGSVTESDPNRTDSVPVCDPAGTQAEPQGPEASTVPAPSVPSVQPTAPPAPEVGGFSENERRRKAKLLVLSKDLAITEGECWFLKGVPEKDKSTGKKWAWLFPTPEACQQARGLRPMSDAPPQLDLFAAAGPTPSGRAPSGRPVSGERRFDPQDEDAYWREVEQLLVQPPDRVEGPIRIPGAVDRAALGADIRDLERAERFACKLGLVEVGKLVVELRAQRGSA